VRFHFILLSAAAGHTTLTAAENSSIVKIKYLGIISKLAAN
jgi:hypothetical protein